MEVILMAFDSEKFSYNVDEEFGDHILEETGNGSTNLRRISWNGRPHKLDIRKYSYKDGEERMMKGVSLSDEAANQLTNTLVDKGFGDTRSIISSIKNRKDFNESMLDAEPNVDQSDDYEEEYYDPKMLLG